MKKAIMIVVTLVLALGMVGCDFESPVAAPSTDTQTQRKQEMAQREMNRQVDIPAIVNWQEKKLLKNVYELKDQADLVRYAYYFNTMTGEDGAFIGKCIGYGMPASAQFSNPEKIVVNEYSTYNGAGGYYGTLPQAEPNGLFMPEGLSATYLILINPDPNGSPATDVAYIESAINVYPWPLDPKDK